VKAIIYTRFSPRKNADECESCELQAAHCEQFAHKKGWTVSQIVNDKSISGADEFRPNLWKAIETLGKGDVLIVYKRDRLARNVYLSEQINRSVEKRGGKIVAVSGDIEGEGFEVVLIRQVLASIAEYERKQIGQRTHHAMQQHQRNGRRMGRYAPYGWSIDPDNPKRMIACPDEAEAVARIVELRAAGMPISMITETLNNEMPEVNRQGEWKPITVAKILKRAKT